MFREKSLERLSSPDRLDQLLRIVKRRAWLPLLAIGGILAFGVVWSFVGRVPITVSGVAVLVHPRKVVSFQSPAAGQVVSIEVRVGDTVEAGDLLATLNLPDVRKQLEQEEARLLQFQSRDRTMSDFEQERALQEKTFLEREADLIKKRIASLRTMATTMRERNRAYIEQQRKNLQTTRALSEELGRALQARFESYRSLKEDGLSSEDAVVNSRRSLIENRLRLAELEVSVQELRLREIQSEENYSQQMDLIADLTVQLQQIELKEAQIERRLLQATLNSTTEASEIRRTIARLKSRLDTQGRIVSKHRGRILEITTSVGGFLAQGQRIGALEVEDPSSLLVGLSYFPVADGKRIKPGMRVRVSPSTVSRERFGSIVGDVTDVSDYPVTTDAAANEIGNREMAQILLGGGNRIEVFARLELAETETGFRWTSRGGPSNVEITAGTTARITVTIEERAPITFLMPYLRSWLGTS